MLDTPILLNILPRIQIESMPKIKKVKKKTKKIKPKILTKPKTKIVSKPKEVDKGPIKISKTYIPKDTEKYMCEKHKVFFRMKLQEKKRSLVDVY